MKQTQLLPGDVELDYDESTDVYRARHDRTDQPLSTVVVAALATAANTDPMELDPLRQSLDPESLDALFAPTYRGRNRDTGRVEFRVADHRVVVDAEKWVEVHPAE